MRYHEITEGPENDFEQVREAQRLMNTFMQFLTHHNENTPLRDIPGVRETFFRNKNGDTIPCYVVSAMMTGAARIGGPNRDLYFGFAWNPDPDSEIHRDSEAFLSRGMNGNVRTYYAMFKMDSDPGDQTELSWGLNWDNLLHELVHYLDYKRGVERDGKPSPDRENKFLNRRSIADYFNDSLELNAYYQMALKEIFRQITQAARFANEKDGQDFYRETLSNFEGFKKRFMIEFRYDWLKHLTPENKKRFAKRFYKLFALVRDKWPNIKAVQDEIARLDKIEREAMAQDDESPW